MKKIKEKYLKDLENLHSITRNSSGGVPTDISCISHYETTNLKEIFAFANV